MLRQLESRTLLLLYVYKLCLEAFCPTLLRADYCLPSLVKEVSKLERRRGRVGSNDGWLQYTI